MTRRKKIAIIIIFYLLILFILDRVLPKEKPSEENVPEGKIPKPFIQSSKPIEGTQSYTIVSQLNKSSLQIPEKLTVYELTIPDISIDYVKNISTKLGLNTKPQELDDALFGKTFVISDETSYLRIVPSLYLIDYKKYTTVELEGSFVNEKQLIETASSFINDNNLLDNRLFYFDSIRYLLISEETIIEVSADGAHVVDIRFVEKIGDYPIVNDSIGVGTINVRINRSGEVIAVYVDMAGNFSSSGEYPVKTFEELENSLNDSLFAGLDNANIPAYNIKDNEIERVVIKNASLGYLEEYNKNQTTLQPIFVLTGTAETKTFGTVPIHLYLSAIKDEYFE